jgi:hypothetical protein
MPGPYFFSAFAESATIAMVLNTMAVVIHLLANIIPALPDFLWVVGRSF